MRSLWKGSISFGLVNIPVKLYTGSHEREFKFTMLHKKDLSEIRYARMCKNEEKEVPWDEIVKGYQYHPGEYVVFDDEDFKKIDVAKTKSIEIIEFVKEDEIDSVFYSKPYFVEPEKNAAGAYTLLRDALKKSKKVGIAKFVIHNREHLAVVKPLGNVIVINQMRYLDELVKTDDLTIPEKKNSSPKELEVALKLIDHLTTHFDPRKFKDTYSEEVHEMIAQKAKGKKIQPKGVERRPTKVQDIMSLLKASIEKQPPATATKRSSRKRMTA